MSAHETRHGNESIFAMRQRHWEGLIAGKKSLHRGQLLPGSSTSDEDPNNGIVKFFFKLKKLKLSTNFQYHDYVVLHCVAL